MSAFVEWLDNDPKAQKAAEQWVGIQVNGTMIEFCAWCRKNTTLDADEIMRQWWKFRAAERSSTEEGV